MTINVGELAPAVRVEAFVRNEADPVSLEIGADDGKWTVLHFYPRDFAFMTPPELRGFAELEEEFEADGAQVMAASTDSWYVHRAWLGSTPGLKRIGYPVIADPTQELTRLFGVLDRETGSARAATFIIAPDGIVRYASVENGILGATPPEETLHILRALCCDERTLQLAA